MCAAFDNKSRPDEIILLSLLNVRNMHSPRVIFVAIVYWPIYANFWIRYPPRGATTSPLYGLYGDVPLDRAWFFTSLS